MEETFPQEAGRNRSWSGEVAVGAAPWPFQAAGIRSSSVATEADRRVGRSRNVLGLAAELLGPRGHEGAGNSHNHMEGERQSS